MTLKNTLSKGILSLSLLIAMSLLPTSLAQPNTQQAPGGERDPLQLFKEAGIDANQETTMRNMAKEFEDKVNAKNTEARQWFSQLKDLTLQVNPDEAKYLHCQEEINKIHSEVSMMHAKFILDLRNVLNQSQKEKLIAIMQQHLQNSMAGGGGGVSAPMPQGSGGGSSPAPQGMSGGSGFRP